MSIAKQAARGVAWNMAVGVSARVLQLVGTVLLTRFIAPDAYGSVIAASIAVGTFGVVTSFAFGQYLIAKKAPPEVAFQAMVLHVGLGVIAMILAYLARAPLGALLDTPSLSQYILGFGIAHLLDRARYVPERLLMRALQFRAIALTNGTGEIVFTVTALALAPRYGAQAVVIAFIVRSALTAVLFFAVAPRAEWWAPAPLRRADVAGLFGYGWPIMVAAVSDRAATRWDNLIISKLFGTGVMAQYNLAYSLAEMPISHVAEHIGEVLMPSFSKMEEAQRTRAVVSAASLLGLVASPLGVGLGAVSPTVVHAFFDERWAGMGPMLTILSVMTVFRPMTWSAVAYLQAVQQTRIIMYASAFRAVIVLSAVAVCGWLGGPLAACVGAGIAYALHSLVTIAASSSVSRLPFLRYVAASFRPLLPCAPMFLAVYWLGQAMLGHGVPALATLVVQIAVGGVLYVAGAFVFVSGSARELLRVGLSALRRR
ncbi:MAG: oligosaccharide flippase family protein [Kofleriaceae bacterium]